ncbi:MAG: hypothetical protein QXO73_04170 [Archaeoglobaceae archaeon]
MLRVALLELAQKKKKMSSKYVLSILLVLLLSLAAFYISITSGFESDKRLYTANLAISDSFTTGSNPDILIYEKIIIMTSKSDRSLAAADEALGILRQQYLEKLSQNSEAFPVLVSVRYLERRSVAEVVNSSKLPNLQYNESKLSTNSTKQIDVFPKETADSKSDDLKDDLSEFLKIESFQDSKREIKDVGSFSTNEYVYPEQLSIRTPFDKLVLAMIFLIPSYFFVQLFSSSFLEDKFSRRLEIIISIFNNYEIVFGKMLPYFAASILAMASISLFLNSSAFFFAIPVVFLLFSFHSAIVVFSRSYREATMLLLIFSLLVTVYAVMPVVFPISEFSRISPLTALLGCLENKATDLQDFLPAFYVIFTLGAFLFYLTCKLLYPEYLYSTGILEKIFAAFYGGKIKSFLLGFFGVSLALFVEFFIIFIIFLVPKSLALPLSLILVAGVEEITKGLSIAANRDLISSVSTALGFFTAEKLLLLLNISLELLTPFLASFLLLPAMLHTATALIFYFFIKFGFWKACAASSLIHFLYNYTVVITIASSLNI